MKLSLNVEEWVSGWRGHEERKEVIIEQGGTVADGGQG